MNTLNRVIKSSRPNEIWEVDLIGRLENNKGENKFILVAIDHYSKWVEACILNNKTGKAITCAIKNLIIDKNGIPERILTDNGLEFINQDFSSLCTTYGIKHQTCSPDHHETVGLVERTNQTLFRKIKKLCEFGKLDWQKQVLRAVFATNVSYNRVIKTSPYIFKFGKTPTFDIDKAHHATQKNYSIPHLHHQRDSSFQKYSEKNIVKGKIKCRNDFRNGDKVLVYRDQIQSKLNSHWADGYTIIERINEDSYRVKKNEKHLRANKKHLKHQEAV